METPVGNSPETQSQSGGTVTDVPLEYSPIILFFFFLAIP